MAAPEPHELDRTAATVELALSGPASETGAAPVPLEQLREHLPGLEPDRRVTDWGRSERIEGVVDRTLYQFLYHYWFRVEAQGIENLPRGRGALLVANRAGALPADSVMVATAIKQEHPHSRPLHLATEQRLSGIPALGMLVQKLGGVLDHPANLHRLLFDEDQLVLAFPEGQAAGRKPISERYRLRAFDGRFVEAAMRARTPIIPVAVLGGEEALPTLARIGPFGRLSSRMRVPIFPALPLPAKFKIRFLEPIATASLGRAPWRDRELVAGLAGNIRALIQENLLEMVAQRRSAWLA